METKEKLPRFICNVSKNYVHIPFLGNDDYLLAPSQKLDLLSLFSEEQVRQARSYIRQAIQRGWLMEFETEEELLNFDITPYEPAFSRDEITGEVKVSKRVLDLGTSTFRAPENDFDKKLAAFEEAEKRRNERLKEQVKNGEQVYPELK